MIQVIPNWNPHKFLCFNSRTAQSTARAVNAIYVNDGFCVDVEVIQAPSVTNTFLHACNRL